MRLVERDPLLLLIDAANAAWIAAIFVLTYQGRESYLTSLWVVTPMSLCVLLHLVRWQRLANRPYEGGGTWFGAALTETAHQFLGQCPHLISPTPSLPVIQALVDRMAAQSPPLSSCTWGGLFIRMARIPHFRAVHAGMFLLCVGGLHVGVIPSYANAIFSLWPVTGLVAAAVAGLGIYSAAILIFVAGHR